MHTRASLLSATLLFLLQVELRGDHPRPSSHGWPLLLRDPGPDDRLWRLPGVAADVSLPTLLFFRSWRLLEKPADFLPSRSSLQEQRRLGPRSGALDLVQAEPLRAWASPARRPVPGNVPAALAGNRAGGFSVSLFLPRKRKVFQLPPEAFAFPVRLRGRQAAGPGTALPGRGIETGTIGRKVTPGDRPAQNQEGPSGSRDWQTISHSHWKWRRPRRGSSLVFPP